MAFAQKLEELDALAQPALHHRRAAYHFADDGRDLRCAEVESAIKNFDGVENFGVRQVWIMEGRNLYPVVIHEFCMRCVKPVILDRLLVEKGSRVWSRQGNL